VKLLLEEIVEHPDADHVLRTLEYFLREISLETSRTEDELIVYGLGPSFRTMNPKDKTTVRATSQSSATTLHAEANFLASALAGDAAQDEIVRSKIERAFESLKTELRYGAAPRSIAAVTLPPVEPAEPSPVVEAVPMITGASTPAPVEIEETPPAPMDHAPDLTQPPSLEAKPEPQPELKIEQKPESKPAPRPEPKPAPQPDEPVLSAPRRSSPVSPVKPMRVAPARKKRSAILLLLPLLLILLAAAGYLLEHRRASQSLFAAKPEENIASTPVENKVIAPAPATAPTPPPPAATPTDVKDWVQAWAAAMRTRDVQAQLAFYATPLDRYFLTPNVGREQLMKDKQAEIDDRKGVWTFKAENVVVQKQTSTNAVVYLNKHIIAELPSSTIREERLKAQLKLKMVDGEWKIISERTIG
jgi:ketosteroid isomerase-like protein